jgi:hypothetical protein
MVEPGKPQTAVEPTVTDTRTTLKQARIRMRACFKLHDSEDELHDKAESQGSRQP